MSKKLFIFAYLDMETITKRERFKKVAGNRVQRLLDTFALLSNCSNRNNYEYTEEDVKLMFTELEKALRQSQEMFKLHRKKEDKVKFLFEEEETQVEEEPSVNSVTSDFWLMAANGNKYDHAAAFRKWGFIDWKQTRKFHIGDIVYIYCSKPCKRISYKAVVAEVNKPFSECVDDERFWKDKDLYKSAKSGSYCRLKLIDTFDDDRLGLESLKKNGLKNAPQGPIKIKADLLHYLESVFSEK